MLYQWLKFNVYTIAAYCPLIIAQLIFLDEALACICLSHSVGSSCVHVCTGLSDGSFVGWSHISLGWQESHVGDWCGGQYHRHCFTVLLGICMVCLACIVHMTRSNLKFILTFA